jgi:hypothetical protein
MRTSLFAILLLVATIAVEAQSKFPGYIITNKKDTLRGDIAFKNKVRGLFSEVSVSSDAGKKSFTVSDWVVVVSEQNDKFIPASFTTDRSPAEKSIKEVGFLKADRLGEVSLAHYQDENRKMHFYLIDKAGVASELAVHIVERSGTQQRIPLYKGVLKSFFSECTELFDKIDKAEFTTESVIKIFDQCYACRYGTKSAYEDKSKKLTGQFGVLLGVAYTRINIENQHLGTFHEYEYDFDNAITLMPGIFFNLKLPFESLQLYNEIAYKRLRSKSPEGYYLDYYTASGTYDNTYLRHSFLFKISLSRKPVKPVLTLGIVNAFSISDKNRLHLVRTFGPTVTKSDENLFESSSSYDLGLTAGFGLTSKKFGFDLRIERSNGPSQMFNIKSRLYSASATLLYSVGKTF